MLLGWLVIPLEDWGLTILNLIYSVLQHLSPEKGLAPVGGWYRDFPLNSYQNTIFTGIVKHRSLSPFQAKKQSQVFERLVRESIHMWGSTLEYN